mmetsp:Transcript_22693/g.49120  ORF Transcript_22693/g.49120 Transcript_22693/m.49120 type:complete len:146 (-) Transcript_22693:3233-3670(-)
MAKMSAMATRAFCPPESCDIRKFSEERLKRTLTPTPRKRLTSGLFGSSAAAFFFLDPPSSSSSESVPSAAASSMAVLIMSSPAPFGTNSLKTSLKCALTPLKVRLIASSFFLSKLSINSFTLQPPSSISSRRWMSCVRCSEKLTN